MQKQLTEFYLSQLLDCPIYDSLGKIVGKVKDIAVLWNGGIPKVTGIQHTIDKHKMISADCVLNWDILTGVKLENTREQLPIVDIRHEELYIGQWLLDKQIIDLNGSKLMRVNDILLSRREQAGKQHLLLIAADVGMRGLLRRIGLEFLVRHWENKYVHWQSITPLASRTGSLQLDKDKEQLRKLHPADIADLVESMDYKTRANFFKALDDEQASDALAEMELDTQVEIVSSLDGDQASDLLENIPPDESANILGKMPEEKSNVLLNLMSLDVSKELKDLMSYEQDSAGGLMTTEYITFPGSLTTEQAIIRLRELATDEKIIYYVYIVDSAEKLLGVLSLRDLITANNTAKLASFMNTNIISVNSKASYHKIAKIIHKYSLLAVPVLSEHGILLGIITVDDVLDFLMPEASVSGRMLKHLHKHTVKRWE